MTAQLLTKKMKNNLASLYKFYLKADEMVNDNKYTHDDAIDDLKVDVNTLTRFKRHLQEEDSVENRNEIERYLVYGCEDPNCRTRHCGGPKNNLEYGKRTYFWHLVLLGKRSCLRSCHLVLWSLGTLTGQQRF